MLLSTGSQRVWHDLVTEQQVMWGFPDSSVGKESACNAGDPGSIPGLGRSTGEVIGYPLQYSWAFLVAQLVKNLHAMWETWVWSLDGTIPWRRRRLPTLVFWPGEFHGLYSLWGHRESDTTEWLSLSQQVMWPWKNYYSLCFLISSFVKWGFCWNFTWNNIWEKLKSLININHYYYLHWKLLYQNINHFMESRISQLYRILYYSTVKFVFLKPIQLFSTIACLWFPTLINEALTCIIKIFKSIVV